MRNEWVHRLQTLMKDRKRVCIDDPSIRLDARNPGTAAIWGLCMLGDSNCKVE